MSIKDPYIEPGDTMGMIAPSMVTSPMRNKQQQQQPTFGSPSTITAGKFLLDPLNQQLPLDILSSSTPSSAHGNPKNDDENDLLELSFDPSVVDREYTFDVESDHSHTSEVERTILQSHIIEVKVPESKQSLSAAEMNVAQITSSSSSSATSLANAGGVLFGIPDSALLRNHQGHERKKSTADVLSDDDGLEYETASTTALSTIVRRESSPQPEPPTVVGDDNEKLGIETVIEIKTPDEQVQPPPESAEILATAFSKLTDTNINEEAGDCEINTNPVVTELQTEPKMKVFKIQSPNRNHQDGNGPIIEKSPLESELPTKNSWILQDYEQLFGYDKNFHSEINLAKSLRFIDEHNDKIPDLSQESIIYLSTRIVNPGKVLSLYFDSKFNLRDLSTPPTKKIIYIDLLLNNNGCNILLQILKYFNENHHGAIKKTQEIHIRILASCIEQMNFVLESLMELESFYHQVKTLGLFIGLHTFHEQDCFYVIDKAMDNNSQKFKLPTGLKKLCLSGFELTDFIQLPMSLELISLHNICSLNFSKFNLLKKLTSLHISGNDGHKINLFGRVSNLPVGFADLKEIKFDSSLLVINPNFGKFQQLTQLGFQNLDFATTRQLKFPNGLKKLEFINCQISSHMSAIPDSLKSLIIIGGKWSPQRNPNLTRLLSLKIIDVDVKDLTEKLMAAKNLFHLEVSGAYLLNIEKLKLSTKLKYLKLVKVNLEDFDLGKKLPTCLETIYLDNNNLNSINELPLLKKCKSLRVSNNNIYGKVDLKQQDSIEEVNFHGNETLMGIEVSSTTKFLNCSGSKVHELIGHNLTKLILNGCTLIDWETFQIPSLVSQLSVQNCELLKFECKTQGDNQFLKMFDLSHNCIEKFDLSNFIKLEDIDLSYNKLLQISQQSFFSPNNSNIKSINVKDNQIHLVELNELTNLEWLQLADNELTDLNSVKLPSSLLTLILNDNNLCQVNEGFILPEKLCHLEMSRCKLTQFIQILPKSMLSLCLSCNKLHSKSFSIRIGNNGKGNLKLLDLNNNLFKSIDLDMFKRLNMSEINLTRNMFDVIPIHCPENILSVLFDRSYEAGNTSF